MPYKHPIYGVECLSVNEFWKMEAERSGVDASDLIGEFVRDIQHEEDVERQRIENDKDGALKSILDYYNADPEEITFLPVTVLKVFDVHVSIGMNKNTTSFCADVICDDGKTRTVKYTECSYGGSFYEPPDFECDCEVL